jgi:hypothetical protein
MEAGHLPQIIEKRRPPLAAVETLAWRMGGGQYIGRGPGGPGPGGEGRDCQNYRRNQDVMILMRANPFRGPLRGGP